MIRLISEKKTTTPGWERIEMVKKLGDSHGEGKLDRK